MDNTGVYYKLNYKKHRAYKITEVFRNSTIQVQRGGTNKQNNIIWLEPRLRKSGYPVPRRTLWTYLGGQLNMLSYPTPVRVMRNCVTKTDTFLGSHQIYIFVFFNHLQIFVPCVQIQLSVNNYFIVCILSALVARAIFINNYILIMD